MLKKKSLRLPVLTALLLTFTGGGVMALTNWTEFNSELNLFGVKTLSDHKSKITSLHTDFEEKIYAEELTATADQRPYKPVVKNFIVKYEETIGEPFSDSEALRLINKELDFYADHYSALGGVQKDRQIIKGDTWSPTRGMIYIAYNDKELGLQGIKAVVTFVGRAKAQQIMTGPDTTITGLEAKDFFDSLQVRGSSEYGRQPIESTWISHTSPLRMFTTLLPPISPPYMLRQPRTETTDNAELMNVTIADPARGQNLFYNVYGYRMDNPLLVADAEAHLSKRHLARYINPSSLKFVKTINKDKSITLSVATAIKPPKGYPYVNYVRYKLYFLGNYVIVQEIMGSQSLAISRLADNLMNNIKFHPLDAHALHVQKKKEGGGAAPITSNAPPKKTVFRKLTPGSSTKTETETETPKNQQTPAR